MPKEKARPGETLVARNKRARFDYDLGDRFEAGIVLKGSEVKMLRAGKADLTDSFCTVLRGEAFLQGVSIASMADAAFGHVPKGTRKLLLHKREIQLLDLAVAHEGMTAVATRIYFKEVAPRWRSRWREEEDLRQAPDHQDPGRRARGERGDPARRAVVRAGLSRSARRLDAR